MVRPLLFNLNESFSKAKKPFMNPMTLNIVAALIDGNFESQNLSAKAGPGGAGDFDRLLQSLNLTQQESFQKAPTRVKPKSPFNKTYIETFKKALLSRGKPLNKVSIKNEDFPIVKEFLFKCGLSRAQVDQLFKDMLENNSEGKVRLSRLFQKISQIDASKNDDQSSNLLEPAAIPLLESMLRGFGLSSKELDGALSAARVEDGRLDLKKFVAKLKGITSRQNSQAPLAAFQTLDRQLADKLKKLGIPLPEQNRSGQVTLKDFISSLEAAVVGQSEEQKLPTGVKASMEQVLAKVVVSEDQAETTIAKARGAEPLGKEGLWSPLLDKVKPASEGVLLAPFKEPGQSVAQKKSWPTLQSKNGPAGQESLFSTNQATVKSAGDEDLSELINKSGAPRTNDKQQGMSLAHQADNIGMLAKLKEGRELKHAHKQESQALKSEAKVFNIQPVNGATPSETTSIIEQSQKPAQDFLPTYLIDQVGRQISRALLKADRTIRLQLKPPELGAMKIEMEIKDNVLKLEMITESKAVKELMMSNVHELKDALTAQGIKVEALDVQVSHDFNHSLANSQEQLKDRQKFIQEQDGRTLTVESGSDDPEHGIWNRSSSDRLLNLVA